MSELEQGSRRREGGAFGSGKPFVLLGSGEPIQITTVQDLIQRRIPHSRGPIVRSFGTVGWNLYVQGMAEKGEMAFVRMVNPGIREFALEPGVPQVPGQQV